MLWTFLVSAALAAEPAFESTAWRAQADELRYHWAPEIALTGAFFGGWKAFEYVTPRERSRVADPHGLDAAPKPRWNERAQGVSDFLGVPVAYKGLNLPMMSIVGVGMWGGVRDGHAGSGVMHSLIAIESYGAAVAVTNALKVSIARPRPYTARRFAAAYPDLVETDAFQEESTREGHWDAYKSMPSGHTSGTAAFAFSIATLVYRDAEVDGGASPELTAATFGTAGALTATVGALRVVGGKHHVTDTVVGGLLGAGIGIGTAWLHTVETSGTAQPAALQLGWQGAW